MLVLANAFFFVFHSALILFNVFGWIPRRTRRLNFICLSLTAVSWGLMGLWYGMGYCVLTDWHWQIRAALGIRESADSYIVLLVQKLTGWTPPTSLANSVALWVFLASFGASVGLNGKDYRIRRRQAGSRAVAKSDSAGEPHNRASARAQWNPVEASGVESFSTHELPIASAGQIDGRLKFTPSSGCLLAEHLSFGPFWATPERRDSHRVVGRGDFFALGIAPIQFAYVDDLQA
jgi:hypothetical protein